MNNEIVDRIERIVEELRALQVVVAGHEEFETLKCYDPNFGDDKLCECGHPYYRHFDTYEDMKPVGCKYCPCSEFE